MNLSILYHNNRKKAVNFFLKTGKRGYSLEKSSDIIFEKPPYPMRAVVNGFTKRAMEGETMNKVGGYDAYVNSYQNYVGQSKEQRESMSAKNAGRISEAANTKPVELSRDAKNLLKELQQKYGNMDFIVGDYETDEEAAAYLARGTKEYSVLIGAEELEEMAKDKSVKKEYTDKIESARNELAYMKSQLEESGEDVKKMGVTFGKDGSTTLFASLEKMGEQQKERIEEAREAKRAEKNSDSGYQKVKRTTVKANSADELLEKIRNVDWDAIGEEKVPVAGGRFDTLG